MDEERRARAARLIVAVPLLLCCLGLPILLGAGASSAVLTWAGAGAVGSVLLAPIVAGFA